MAGIGVVYNPNAKANRARAGRVDRLAEIVGAFGVVRGTESVPHIEEVAREFRDRAIEVLGICGGDGSYHCTLTAFHAVYGDTPLPMLLPLRAGTINYVSDSIGSRRGSPEQVLARVVRDYRYGHTFETTERDALRINGREIGFVLSFGSAVNFLRAYYARERQGPWSAAALLGRVILSAIFHAHLSRAILVASEADIECDGEPLPFRQYSVFLAATVNRIALGFQPTYLGSRKRGYFHVVGGPIPAGRIIRHLVRLYRGFPTSEPTLYDNLAQRMTIRFFRPTAYMLDGDIVSAAERLDVDVGRRLTLIRH